jgi:hypothetical protein
LATAARALNRQRFIDRDAIFRLGQDWGLPPSSRISSARPHTSRFARLSGPPSVTRGGVAHRTRTAARWSMGAGKEGSRHADVPGCRRIRVGRLPENPDAVQRLSLSGREEGRLSCQTTTSSSSVPRLEG